MSQMKRECADAAPEADAFACERADDSHMNAFFSLGAGVIAHLGESAAKAD
jgi:hypothetical protein